MTAWPPYGGGVWPTMRIRRTGLVVDSQGVVHGYGQSTGWWLPSEGVLSVAVEEVLVAVEPVSSLDGGSA